MTAIKAKPLTPWKVSRGPIKVDRYSLEAAMAINALLIAPIGVLPQVEGDIVLPFNIGISADIEARLRADASLPHLRKAVRRYTHSAGYLYATAQPDAHRHDIAGQPTEAVNESDRLNARQSFCAVQEQRKQWREKRDRNQLGHERPTETIDDGQHGVAETRGTSSV